MVNVYDILVILKPNLGEESYKKLIDSFQTWIKESEGDIISVNEWGQQSTGNTFKKHTQGYYFACQYKGTAKTVNTIYDKMKVNESFIRHLNIRADSIMTREAVEKLK